MTTEKPQTPPATEADKPTPTAATETDAVQEIGGPQGPEPTRFGDWERAGRCSDF